MDARDIIILLLVYIGYGAMQSVTALGGKFSVPPDNGQIIDGRREV